MSRICKRLLCASAFSVVALAAAEAADVEIGVVAPMTGQLASEGPDTENTVKLAIADVDAKGGVLGGGH